MERIEENENENDEWTEDESENQTEDEIENVLKECNASLPEVILYYSCYPIQLMRNIANSIMKKSIIDLIYPIFYIIFLIVYILLLVLIIKLGKALNFRGCKSELVNDTTDLLTNTTNEEIEYIIWI